MSSEKNRITKADLKKIFMAFRSDRTLMEL